jgi:integrase
MTGADRYHLYLTACATGFRAGELASLTPASFDLGALPARVTLPARKGKNRRLAVQPLPADVAEALRDYLAGRPADLSVWPGCWSDRAADMLRPDLAAAGIPFRVEGPDGPLFADFHALRHTCITMLEQSGVTIKQAQVLARHSDPKLTIGRYSHATLAKLGDALGKLPPLTSPDAAPSSGLTPLSDLLPRRLVEALAWAGLAVLSGGLVAHGDAPLFGMPRDETGQKGTGQVDEGVAAA